MTKLLVFHIYNDRVKHFIVFFRMNTLILLSNDKTIPFKVPTYVKKCIGMILVVGAMLC